MNIQEIYNQIDEDVIEIFTYDLADILDIDDPDVIVDDDLLNYGVLACFMPDEYSVHICLETDNLFNILFALAHEFRHIWQYEEDEEKYVKNQKSKMELGSKAYNLQIAEIDANAFAHLIMTNWFGVKPTFENLDDEVKEAIYKREKEIAEDLNMKVYK